MMDLGGKMAKGKLARMEWEKPYLEALIDELRPSGKVLEVGFGLGYSASRIQTYKPEHLTIIEKDASIAAQAAKWAGSNPAITIVQDKWENALPKLGRFDAIFFNDFEPEIELAKLEQQETGSLLVKQGKELISKVKQEIPKLTEMRYSDADIDAFFSEVGQFHKAEMAVFLHELHKNGQISKQQYEAMIAKYNLTKTEAKTLKIIEERRDQMMAFLKACLKSHMHKGSRFSCFSSSPLSKYENPEFFEAVITNTDLDYEERLITVNVPKSCAYYKHEQALIMVIQKQL